MIRQCMVYLNGKSIQQVDTNYNYRAYIESLLAYNETQTKIHLNGCVWELDTPGKMDNLTTKKNTGLGARKTRFAKGTTVELYGRLHNDLFHQQK